MSFAGPDLLMESAAGVAVVIDVVTVLDVVVVLFKATVALLFTDVPAIDAPGVAVIVSVSVPPLAATVPSVSVTVLPVTDTEPAESVATMFANPVGNVSVTIAPVAAAPPVSVTVIV